MKFELDEILTVIDRVASTRLSSFEYEDTDTKLKIRGAKTADMSECGHTAEAAEQNQFSHMKDEEGKKAEDHPEFAEENAHNALSEKQNETQKVIVSPMVGIFYTAPAEGAEAFVHVGDTIQKGQVIGIVEAMKLMNEIEADCDGVVEEIFVKNNQLVEYEQPLVRIRKAQK